VKYRCCGCKEILNIDQRSVPKHLRGQPFFSYCAIVDERVVIYKVTGGKNGK
jgi:uncharacterized protein YlaI